MRPCLEKTLHKKGLVEWSRCSTQVQTAVLQTKKKKKRKERKEKMHLLMVLGGVMELKLDFVPLHHLI
jgi:hypothetical protein